MLRFLAFFLLINILASNGEEAVKLTLCENSTVSIGTLQDAVFYSAALNAPSSCSVQVIDLPQPYWVGAQVFKRRSDIGICRYTLTIQGTTVCSNLVANRTRACISGDSTSLSLGFSRTTSLWDFPFYVPLTFGQPICDYANYSIDVKSRPISQLVSHSQFNYGDKIPLLIEYYSNNLVCSVSLTGFKPERDLLLLTLEYFQMENKVSGSCVDYLRISSIKEGTQYICGTQPSGIRLLYTPLYPIIQLFMRTDNWSFKISSFPGFLLKYEVVIQPDISNATLHTSGHKLLVTCLKNYYINNGTETYAAIHWNSTDWIPQVECIERNTELANKTPTQEQTTTTNIFTTPSTITPNITTVTYTRTETYMNTNTQRSSPRSTMKSDINQAAKNPGPAAILVGLILMSQLLFV